MSFRVRIHVNQEFRVSFRPESIVRVDKEVHAWGHYSSSIVSDTRV